MPVKVRLQVLRKKTRKDRKAYGRNDFGGIVEKITPELYRTARVIFKAELWRELRDSEFMLRKSLRKKARSCAKRENARASARTNQAITRGYR